MSRKKKAAIISVLSAVTTGFTVWDLIDFSKSNSHSTVAYIALIFNLYAIAELVKLIYREVTRHE